MFDKHAGRRPEFVENAARGMRPVGVLGQSRMFCAIRGWTPCNCAVVTPIEPLQAAVTGGRLLAQYAQAAGLEVKSPIRIEDIVEKHLKLRVDFDDLHRLLGVPRDGFGVEPDIFGAIWLKETGEIYIDEILDPEERPVSKDATGSRLRMKAAANGDCTDRWSWRPAAKDHCPVTCRGRQSFVQRAKQRSGWSFRPTFMLRVC